MNTTIPASMRTGYRSRHRSPAASRRRARRLAGLLTACLAGLVTTGLTALPASAAPSASSAVPAARMLASVSCPDAAMCMAVGGPGNVVAQLAGELAERWDGHRWTVQSVRKPAGATLVVLLGVSCSSATACSAAGYDERGSGLRALAERWNGSTWAIQPTPKPAGATNWILAGVSCASARTCTAVGSYSTGSSAGMLAEAWHGTTWVIQPAHGPTGNTGTHLDSVSCPAASACTAVGDFEGVSDQGTGMAPLAMHWNGRRWAVTPAPYASSAANGTDSFLNGVSCSSGRRCMAVGSDPDGNGIAIRWNGQRWALTGIPGAPAASVSCPARLACTSAGPYFGDAVSGSSPQAYGWDGQHWTDLHPPMQPGGAPNWLSGISCSSSGSCTAVGQQPGKDGGLPVAMHWNGHSWTVQPTPNP